MSDREPMALRTVPDNTRVVLGRPAWEPHPDGTGGYRPIIESLRGTIELPCPHCGAKLVREGSEPLVRNSFFGCGACHHKSAGNDAITGSPRG